MFSHSSNPIARCVRVALVGCGRVSLNHLKALSFNSELCELVAICDIDDQAIEQAKSNIVDLNRESHSFGESLEAFSSYTQLLEAITSESLLVDLVVICTPSGLHPQHVIQAARVGVSVCTEKPMATRWSDGIDMVKECDASNVNLFVVKQNRFNKTVQIVKNQLVSGRFGRLSMISANVFWQRPQSYYDQAAWRGTWEFDGGALMNQASHYVDLLEWLVGPVESVNAFTSTLGRSIEVEDTASLQLRWRNGALGTMAVTMLTYPKNLEGSITILGDNGSARIGGTSLNKIDLWEFSESSDNDELVARSNYMPDSVYGYGHTPYYTNMLKALRGEEPPLCNGREGLRSLELLIGAYRSARDGKCVHFPLDY